MAWPGLLLSCPAPALPCPVCFCLVCNAVPCRPCPGLLPCPAALLPSCALLCPSSQPILLNLKPNKPGRKEDAHANTGHFRPAGRQVLGLTGFYLLRCCFGFGRSRSDRFAAAETNGRYSIIFRAFRSPGFSDSWHVDGVGLPSLRLYILKGSVRAMRAFPHL